MGMAVVASSVPLCTAPSAVALLVSTPSRAAQNQSCASQVVHVAYVKSFSHSVQSGISRCPPAETPIVTNSGLRVGRVPANLGSVRHEYGYQELEAGVLANYGGGRGGGGALASEMNIFARLARIVRSSIEQFVSAGEDPEKMIDQAVEEMNTDIIKLRQTAAQVLSAKQILENKYTAALRASEEWYKRASRALERGDEALAKEALKRRKAFADNAKSLKAQLDQQVSVSDRILSSTRVLEGKIYEARNKKDLLKARAQSAKTSKQVNEVLGSVDATSALSAYKRMEEKVERLEAEADAVTQMAYDDLGSKFAQLEMDVDVDDDLKSLKADLSESSSTQQILYSGFQQLPHPAMIPIRGELPPWERVESRSPDRTRAPQSYQQY